MEPLIKITNIPIAIEFKVNNARLEYTSSDANMEVSRDSGGLKVRSQPIRLSIDTFECFNSITPTTMTSIKQAAEKGRSIAYDATATYAQEGKLLLSAKLGEDVLGQIIASKMKRPADIGLEFLPNVPPKITWSDPEMTIQYEMDKLNFDWKIANGNFEFIPGNIEISVSQQPDVVIEYIGGPIYVPPSADPEYVPVDVRA